MNYDYSNKITLISLNDSLLQNLKSNKQKKTDIVLYKVVEKLNAKGLSNILPIDCGSLFVNKQHNITEFLHNNLSLAEIKAVQKLGIDKARHGIAKLALSEKLKDYYSIETNDSEIHISDAIKQSNKVGVLLSCVSNDMMSSVWANPISYMLAHLPFMDKTVLERTSILLKDKTLRDKIIDGLKANMEKILGINDNAKICTFGIYRPKILPQTFDIIFDEINDNVHKTAREYNQNYIDINNLNSKMIDFHPNTKGYEDISTLVADRLRYAFRTDSIIKRGISNFEYHNLGLEGAINDSKQYEQQEIEYVNNFLQYVIEKYHLSLEQAKKVFHDFLVGRPQEAVDMTEIYTDALELVKKYKNTK